MKRILAFLSLLVVTHLPVSCGCDDGTSCGCEDFGPPKEMVITAFQLEAGVFKAGEFEMRNSLDTLNYQEAGIKLQVNEVEYRNAQSSLRFSLMNQAYACSPIEPEPPEILSINISSGQSLWVAGKEYKAGESLNKLFFIANKSCGAANLCDINSFLEMQQESPWQFGYQNDFLIFQLLQEPDSLIHQAFQVDVILSGSTSASFSLATPKMIIR